MRLFSFRNGGKILEIVMGFTNAPGQKPSNGIETTEACCWTHVDIFEGSSLFFVYSFAYQVGVPTF